jgi:hypothetical protein
LGITLFIDNPPIDSLFGVAILAGVGSSADSAVNVGLCNVGVAITVGVGLSNVGVELSTGSTVRVGTGEGDAWQATTTNP